jgi:glyoxylase-like metal-dependent hydrolase (beta-lactamase superfamily II)
MRESDRARRHHNTEPAVAFWFLVISFLRGWARAHETACRRLFIALVVVGSVTTAASLGAQQPQAGDRAAIEVLPVQKSVYMLAGAGGNVTVQIGREGVLLVDTGLAASAAQVTAEIRKLSKGPIRVIINTHVHPDHVGGNAAFAAQPPDPLQPLDIIGHENVLGRLARPVTGQETPALIPGLPRSEYFTPTKDLHFNDEAIVLYHEPKAHTDGDSVILFRGSDVVSVGDIFTPGAYPFIDLDVGGSIQGEIAALNHILALTVPKHTQEGGTYVIPGHGRICDEADVVEYRDMVVIVRDRIQDLIGRRMTLDQIKAARPTRDYDGEYVTPASFVSADRFVESIYKSLSQR